MAINLNAQITSIDYIKNNKINKMKNSKREIPPVIYKNNPKVISIISYLTIIGWLLAYVLNDQKSPLASFHLRQSLGIYLVFLVSSMFMWIPILGWLIGFLISLLGVACWIHGVISAFGEEMKAVPFLGSDFQNWFAGL